MFESIAASIQEAIQAGNGNVDAVLQVGAGAVPSRPQCLVSRPCHMFTETGPAAATSAPGLGSPVPHLHRDWARPCHICTVLCAPPTFSGELRKHSLATLPRA